MQSDSNRADDFWVAYTLGAYQPLDMPGAECDNDPDGEGIVGGRAPVEGITNQISGKCSLILLDLMGYNLTNSDMGRICPVTVVCILQIVA